MGTLANNVKNVALIGHGGEGKTTLAEAILFNAKVIDRQGRTDDGNTTMDRFHADRPSSTSFKESPSF